MYVSVAIWVDILRESSAEFYASLAPRWYNAHCLSHSRMCSQALIVTHQLAEKDQFDSYLTQVLFPLRPVLSFGRSAAAEPAASVETCVWYWWKDCPYAT